MTVLRPTFCNISRDGIKICVVLGDILIFNNKNRKMLKINPAALTSVSGCKRQSESLNSSKL